MRSKQSGFTLIEIAIVLVIIGLLLGGVLKGQELINSAKIKNVANDLNGISAAVYSYQDRYKTYPGDDNGALARWGVGVPDGDKNGVVGGVGGAAAAGSFNEATAALSETIYFWRHLRLAGFVGGDTANGEQPQNALGGIVGVQTGTGNPAPLAPDISSLVVCTSNLNGKIAEAIDRQFDDGLIATGTLRGYVQAGAIARGGANPTRVAAVGAYNAADDTVLYTICKSL
ncbi:MAG: prepilin-type N-terminal cleavage/methylation domain-containing protein [Rhodocyclaceae bacterium]|nr:prepilin-type N-terminal cleavage/methylation domain-containing protein [Rhodocyclaceae bacterium]